MLKKINNYHLFFLIIIVFILNTILFRSIDITKAQWDLPEYPPGQETANIVTSPLSADLDIGGQSIIGDGDINANGTICDSNGCIGDTSFSGGLNVDGDIIVTNTIKSGSGSLEVNGRGWGMNFSIDTDANSSDDFKWWSDGIEIMNLDGNTGNLTINANLEIGTINDSNRLTINRAGTGNEALLQFKTGGDAHWVTGLDNDGGANNNFKFCDCVIFKCHSKGD